MDRWKRWKRTVLYWIFPEEEYEPLPPPTYDVPIPYLIACGFAPIECEECHLPGDCPLCGAE